MRPLISVIIPCYNRSHLLGQTLNSVINQTFEDWECLVIDDASNDRTEELIEFYSLHKNKIKYFKNCFTKGGQGARNTGMRKSSGTYLIFLDSDDVLAPDCLEKRLTYFNQYRDQDFLVFQCKLFFDQPGDSNIVANYLTKKKDDLSRFIMFDYPWNTSATILKKAYLSDQNIFWSENIKIHQDLDFYIKLLCRNPKYKKIITQPDIFIRMKGVDKLSKSSLSQGFLGSKYLFLQNIFFNLQKANLLQKYREELYGLGLSYMKLFDENSQPKLFFKIPFLFLKNQLITCSGFLVTDHIYQKSRHKYKNRFVRKILSLYRLTNFNERIKYLPPNGTTLGKVSVQQHLKNY